MIMTKDKFITDELIEAKMIEKGYGEKSSHDEEHVRKLILDHYEVELTDRWQQNCDYYIYEESTADGYSVFVACYDTRSICVNEDVHYYDSELSGLLQDAIRDGGEIYVDDLHQDFIDDAIRELYEYLAERMHGEAIDELIDEGYEPENTI